MYFEQMLVHLSKLIPDDKVTSLGVEMGFQMAEINRFQKMNSGGASPTPAGTLKLIQDWNNKTPREGKEDRLKGILQKVGLTGLAEDIVSLSEKVTDIT